MSRIVVQRSAAALPQSAAETLFTVAGGEISLVLLFAKVTSSFGPSGGSGDVTIGMRTLFSIGPATTTPGYLLGGNGEVDLHTLTPTTNFPLVVSDGSDVVITTASSSTGQVEWTLVYEPVTPGSKVEAV